MRQLTKKTWGPSVILAAAGLALAACGASGQGGTATAASAGASAAKKDVKTGTTSLGTILVNSRSRSLYDLSVEKKGHFICTGSCTQTWHPLRPRKGKSPTGVSHLSTLKRPDGTKQIAYKGHPLYTFAGDSKAGDTKGQGFKDVGTWSVIKVKSSSTTQQTQTNTQTTGGGMGYPGY
jgi:predicted lipoprotein with Yx(FWY)xxD motif